MQDLKELNEVIAGIKDEICKGIPQEMPLPSATTTGLKRWNCESELNVIWLLHRIISGKSTSV